MQRVRIEMEGVLQGVGFRPFVFRLAKETGLAGWVTNTPSGVTIEAEGASGDLDVFMRRLRSEGPPNSFIQNFNSSNVTICNTNAFSIIESVAAGSPDASVPPDLATCPDCLSEILDPEDRRFRYPFTNCTRCGPRFTLIESVPYDRPSTSMKGFSMCRRCRAEYEDPADRRFHAQPIACPDCGPGLELWSPAGVALLRGDAALRKAAAAVREGRIVAVKGLGGFHLFADATDGAAVARLRERKGREEKPLAVMFPDIKAVGREVEAPEEAARLLASPAAPIVLLRKLNPKSEFGNPKSIIASSVAPGNPYLGVLLPYTPLHHLLMREIGGPAVATSGNRSEEPIAIDEREAVGRLAGIADLFLVHNRPIVRHADDSVVRLLLNSVQVLRRGRGYAPAPLDWNGPDAVDRSNRCFLAVGGHLKNTVGLLSGGRAHLSQHIGDLSTAESVEAHRRAIADLQSFRSAVPESVLCDAHPDYASTQFAKALSLPVRTVQHHHAHVAACMADNGISGRVLGVAWDGAGYGTDGAVWGGEFLDADAAGFSRVASFRTFPLPGGEAAVREPRRAAIGLLYEMMGPEAFERDDLSPVKSFIPVERRILRGMLEKGINAPRTSSAGRLFDAVAALTGLRFRATFEGQAAMELEYAAGAEATESYPLVPGAPDEDPAGCARIDWEPMVREILADIRRGRPAGWISARFHEALAWVIPAVAARARRTRVVLTGGCFQNRRLTERAVVLLREAGFTPYWHRHVPPNDGGIALGQLRVGAEYADGDR